MWKSTPNKMLELAINDYSNKFFMEQMWLSSTKSFNHIDLWKEKNWMRVCPREPGMN